MIHTQREWVEGKRVMEVSKEASDRIVENKPNWQAIMSLQNILTYPRQ